MRFRDKEERNLVIVLLLIAVVVLAFVAFYKPVKQLKYQDVFLNGQENVVSDVRSIDGNKDDLISFSILPNSEVHGVVSFRGSIKGAYFYEGNILINILDANKNILKHGNAKATTEWMTSGPVDFEGNIDFSGLPNGFAYIEIHNDNASELKKNDKSVLIPIIIK